MKVLMIGLGRMGLGIAESLKSTTSVFGFDPDGLTRMKAAQLGITVSRNLVDLAEQGKVGERVFWIMVPSTAVGGVLDELYSVMGRGDIIVEGGNSFYKDSIARAKRFEERGAFFLDMGVSGGIHGKDNGYCLMVGGEKQAYDRITPFFQTVAQAEGCRYLGRSGSGHFVKMVHNAVEYGMLQVIGEGFEHLKAYDEPLNLTEIADLWNHGSVVRSWLLELLGGVVGAPPLENSEVVGGGETGIWAVKDSLERRVAMPSIGAAVNERLCSQRESFLSRQLISSVRNSFGGHLPPRKAKR